MRRIGRPIYLFSFSNIFDTLTACPARYCSGTQKSLMPASQNLLSNSVLGLGPTANHIQIGSSTMTMDTHNAGPGIKAVKPLPTSDIKAVKPLGRLIFMSRWLQLPLY